MAQILLGITTDLTCQSWIDLEQLIDYSMAQLLPRRRQDKWDKRAVKNTSMRHTMLSKKGFWYTALGACWNNLGKGSLNNFLQ